VRRLPIIATMIVALAVATMLALGVWQLQRATWKDALVARYAANATLPQVAFPSLGPVPDTAMFRASQVNCVRVTGWRLEGGRSASGRPGTRHIAECATGAERPGALIDMGVASDPRVRPIWTGGIVDGTITTEPNRTMLITGLFGASPVLRPMLIARTPAPGLAASAPPSVAQISNNHRAYAVQWFVFAGVALIIFVLALRRRSQR
jgi:surfeit locus 1 family protein